MKDENGNQITLVHNRFQACCKDGCGLISAHQQKRDAIVAAYDHTCQNTEVWDSMSHDKQKDIVWRKNILGQFAKLESDLL